MKKILLFIFILAGVSCRKTVEKIKEVEKKYAWNELKDLRFGDRVQHNSTALNDSIILFNNKTSVQTYNANSLQLIKGFIWGFQELELSHKPAVDKNILVRSLKNYIEFAPLNNLITISGTAVYNPVFEKDTNFIEFETQFIRFNQQFHVVQGRYILAPFRSKKSSGQKAYAYLFRLNQVNAGGVSSLELNNVKETELTNATGVSWGTGFYSVSSYFDKYFLSIGDNTYRIDTAGNVKSFGAPMYSLSDVFRIGNNLFGVNPNGRFYVSTDQGESWSLFTDLGNSIYGFIAFEQVGDEVFAYYRDQIWQITLTGNTLNFIELKNEGLERTSITSITKAGDKVFVTTLFGVYYRKWTDFKEKKN